MRIPILGLEIRRTQKKALPSGLSSPSTRGGWFSLIHEPFTGAWQRNISATSTDVVTNPVVWACVTLISGDISTLWLKLVERDENRIWTEVENAAHSPVLRTPNHYSTRIKFYEYWLLSKLLRGNAYALKERDASGIVRALHVLDPTRVQVLIADDGSVFYQLNADDLAGIENAIVAPAREIIHDVMVPLYHPLVGVSPIFAAGMAALEGLKIQAQSTKLFENGITASGILTAPGMISNDTAERLESKWAASYAGPQNAGKVIAIGDGLTYQPLTMTAVDAQLIDQLRWSDERICACFHVPGYMVGIGSAPPYTDIQSLYIQYYNQALRPLIENLEELLDKGLEMPRRLGVEFDVKALLRMDTATQVKNATAGISGGLLKPNEARAEFDLKPVEGGDAVYLQQQNYSLAALNKRDKAEGAPPSTAQTPRSEPAPSEDEMNEQDTAASAGMRLLKGLEAMEKERAA